MIMLKVLRWTMFLIGMRLELDNNFFDGTIPASIGGLRNLTSLSLRGNQLTREIPVEPFNCIGLVSLDLGSNSLTGHVPKSISRPKLLDNLVLSWNNLSGFIPQEVCSGFQKAPLPDSEFTQHYDLSLLLIYPQQCKEQIQGLQW